MDPKTVINLTTGVEDAANVRVAFLVAVEAVETGRETAVFLTKEAVRLAVSDFTHSTEGGGYARLASLLKRYAAAGGKYFVCSSCFDARALDPNHLVDNAVLNGTVLLREWIGKNPALTLGF